MRCLMRPERAVTTRKVISKLDRELNTMTWATIATLPKFANILLNGQSSEEDETWAKMLLREAGLGNIAIHLEEMFRNRRELHAAESRVP